MLGLIGNLSFLEIGVVLVVAVLAFGRRLPEVAGQAAAQLYRARRALADLRRESGIDEELRKARRTIDAADLAMRKTGGAPAAKPPWYPKSDPGTVPRSESRLEASTPTPAGPVEPAPGSSGPISERPDQDDDVGASGEEPRPESGTPAPADS